MVATGSSWWRCALTAGTSGAAYAPLTQDIDRLDNADGRDSSRGLTGAADSLRTSSLGALGRGSSARKLVASASSQASRRSSVGTALVQSARFQAAVVGVVCLNTITLALEADAPDEPCWVYIDSVFLMFFCLELCARIAADGFCGFFRGSPERQANVFDFLVVFLGVLDQWVFGAFWVFFGGKEDEAHAHFGQAKLIVCMRMVRILRVLRAVRLIRHFAELRLLVEGLVSSFQSVVWISALFLLLVFGSAVFVTDLVGTGQKPLAFEDPKAIRTWFGGVGSSMLTLFIFLTCDDWSTPARMVNKVYPWMEVFWILYMVIGAFTLLSLLTGLMADKLNAVREAEDLRREEEEEARLRSFIDAVEVAFRSGDENADGKVDRGEFQRLLADARVAEGLRLCSPTPARAADDLFDALDKDGAGKLSWNDFSRGLLGLSPELSGRDLMRLESTIYRLDALLAREAEHGAAKTWHDKVSDLHARAAAMSGCMRALERDVRQFFAEVGYDPHAAAPQE